MDDQRMLELAAKAAGMIGGYAEHFGEDNATDDAIGRFRRLIDLVRAEENEAIIAAANALENIASTSSSTRIRRVANDALTAIRARRK